MTEYAEYVSPVKAVVHVDPLVIDVHGGFVNICAVFHHGSNFGNNKVKKPVFYV